MIENIAMDIVSNFKPGFQYVSIFSSAYEITTYVNQSVVLLKNKDYYFVPLFLLRQLVKCFFQFLLNVFYFFPYQEDGRRNWWFPQIVRLLGDAVICHKLLYAVVRHMMLTGLTRVYSYESHLSLLEAL